MYCDTRLGNVEKWYYTAPEDAAMRIPDMLTQCVCYICVKYVKGEFAGQYKPIGTAFFVGVMVENYEFIYLVTAKHNLTKIYKLFDTFYLRLNDKKTGTMYVPVEKGKAAWTSFDNMDIDLAVLAVGGIDRERFEHRAIPLDNFATSQVLLDQYIGLGDDVFAVGLFTGRAGTEKNIPIVRTGIISSMPEEPIRDGSKAYNAFLVELRSIGGVSGSPVFVYLDRHRATTTLIPHNQLSTYHFLGIIRGKWTMDQNLLQEQEEIDVALAYNKGESLNLGIAIVTPAEDLWHLIMNDESIKKRQDYVNDHRTSETITEDSDMDVEDMDSGFTELNFQTSLKKVSKKLLVAEPDALKPKE